MTRESRALVTVAVAALLIASFLLFATPGPAPGSPTISRFSVAAGLDDATQRGVPSEQFRQDAASPIDYLGRSDDPEKRLNSGVRFVTDLQPGEHVAAAFLRGWNQFGQSYSGCIYGDLTAGSPDFGDRNPWILDRPHTTRCVIWSQTSIPWRAGYTPDISPLLNELTARAGFDGTVTFLLLGLGGRDNQSIDWRAYENSVGPAPSLELDR